MQTINHGVQAGGNVVFQDSNVSFNAGQGSSTLEDECLRSLAIGTVEAREDLPERTPHTGEWILTHPTYRSWREEGGLLWIQGRPGTGKSMLLDFLIETERETCGLENTTVLSFFFEHSGRGAERYDLKATMFRSLCYQLIRAHRHLLAHFMTHTNFARKSQVCKETGTRYIWKGHELLSWLGAVTQELLPKDHTIVVFVDALNELGPGPATESAERFRTIAVEQLGSFFVCISCHKYLSDGSKLELDDDIVVSCQDENLVDIKMYVDAQLALKQGTSDHQELRSIRTNLISGANGVFQWLKWSIGKARKLIKDGEDVLQRMRAYPKELHAVYEQTLESLDIDELETAHRLLECLALADGAMTVEDLRLTVCLDGRLHYRSYFDLRGSPEYCDSNQLVVNRIERLSRGLVRTSRIAPEKLKNWPTDERLLWLSCASNKVQMLHFDHDSVKDYMLNNGLKLLERRMSKQMLSTPERHGHMAMRFLALLHSDEVVRYARSNQRLQECMLFGDYIVESRPPLELYPEPLLVQYAALHWNYHAAAAEEDASTVNKLATMFMARNFFDWAHLAMLQEMTYQGVSSNYCVRSTLLYILSKCGLSKVLLAVLSRLRAAKPVNVDMMDLIEATDGGGRTALFAAADSGSSDTVRILLQHGANVNRRSGQRVTPLHRAALHGHIDVAELLLSQRETEVNALDWAGRTPLYFAIWLSSLPAIKLLLPLARQGIHSPGAKTLFCEQQEWSANTALAQAFRTSSVEVLHFLLDSWGPNDTPQEVGQDSLLHVISKCKHECRVNFDEKADLLINSGIFDVNWKGEWEETPLLSAIRNGARKVVKLLLQRRDVKIDQSNNDEDTALVYAAREDDLRVTKMLLNSGKVDVNRSARGRTPLHAAVRYGAHKVVAELLQQCDIQPDLADRDGCTPFLEAVLSEDVLIAARLASTGKVNLNVRDADWNPAIHLAIDSDNTRLVMIFHESEGANVELSATDSLGFPPLIRAVRRGKFAIVMGLLMQGQMDVVDSLGAMPLMVSFARDEYERNPTSQERETILALLRCLNSNNNVVRLEAYKAVQKVFSENEESVTFSDILANLDFAQRRLQSMHRLQAVPYRPSKHIRHR